MRFVGVLPAECAPDEQAARGVAGPGLGQGAQQREQDRSLRERHQGIGVAHL